MSTPPYRTAEGRESDEPAAASDPNETQTWNSRLACPRCSVPLFAARKAGVRVDACGGCGGVWLSSADAQRMLKKKTRAPGQLAEQAAASAHTLSVRDGAILCPECDIELARTVVPPSNVEIDVCAKHGSWFDRSELVRVVDDLIPLPRRAVHAPTAPSYGVQASPAPTAREIAAEVYRQERNREAVGAVVDMLFRSLKS